MTHVTCRRLPRTGISSGTLHLVIEYGLPLPFFYCNLFSTIHTIHSLCAHAQPWGMRKIQNIYGFTEYEFVLEENRSLLFTKWHTLIRYETKCAHTYQYLAWHSIIHAWLYTFVWLFRNVLTTAIFNTKWVNHVITSRLPKIKAVSSKKQHTHTHNTPA